MGSSLNETGIESLLQSERRIIRAVSTCAMTYNSNFDSVPALACHAVGQGILLRWRASTNTESQVKLPVKTQADTDLYRRLSQMNKKFNLSFLRRIADVITYQVQFVKLFSREPTGWRRMRPVYFDVCRHSIHKITCNKYNFF
jgi:hypothetical protein